MRLLLTATIVTLLYSCSSPSTTEQVKGMTVHINRNIENDKEDYFTPILDAWLGALDTSRQAGPDADYWARDMSPYPEMMYYALRRDVALAIKNDRPIQCTVMGLIPVERDHYMLKTMFTSHVNDSDTVHLAHINTVYAKLIDDAYKLVSATDYLSFVYENRTVGDVNYVIHPNHDFNLKDAERMNAFNQALSKIYETTPITFSYYVANNGLDLLPDVGLDFFDRSYQAVQSGGMADNYNKILYAANNSAYYPHELVHLYNHQFRTSRAHQWIDEGIAALLGGSTGYEIEWHWQKLKDFLGKHPDFDLSDPTSLKGSIDNGEYMTDWMYAIGGLICQEINEKHGMKTLLSTLNQGSSDEDYYEIIKTLLNVDKSDIDSFIKKRVKALPLLTIQELEQLAY